MRRLGEHEGEMAIPALVWHELRFRCLRLARSKRREAIERYLDNVVAVCFPVLEYERRAADWHARERAGVVASGRTPPFVDGQIAAIARGNDLILVTANGADFARVQGSDGAELVVTRSGGMRASGRSAWWRLEPATLGHGQRCHPPMIELLAAGLA